MRINAHSMHAYIQSCNSVWHQVAVATKAGEAKVQRGVQFKFVITAIVSHASGLHWFALLGGKVPASIAAKQLNPVAGCDLMPARLLGTAMRSSVLIAHPASDV